MGIANCEGNIRSNQYPLCIGRNAEEHHQHYAGWLSNSRYDYIEMYNRDYHPTQLKSDGKISKEDRVLKMDFDRIHSIPEYLSYGISPFCINGVIFSDRTLQPESISMKDAHSPVQAKAVDLNKGLIKIFNYHNFTNLNYLDFYWEVQADGKIVDRGSKKLDLDPRNEKNIEIPYDLSNPKPDNEYWLNIKFKLPEKTQWAKKGHLVYGNQFKLPFFRMSTNESIKFNNESSLSISQENEEIKVLNDHFEYIFDSKKARLGSVKLDGNCVKIKGARLNVFRAPIANEVVKWGKAESKQWYEMGLDDLKHRVIDTHVNETDSLVEIEFVTHVETAHSPDFFINKIKYQVYPNGDIQLLHDFKPVGSFKLDWLPNIGVQFGLPEDYKYVKYYGLGPYENYIDRNSGFVNVYSTNIDSMITPYILPQSYGNRAETRWIALEGRTQKLGIIFWGQPKFNFNITPFENIDRAQYAFQLERSNKVWLNINHQVTGVGGTPVSALPEYRTFPKEYKYSIRFRPYNKNTVDPAEIKYTKYPDG
jgi:beta-galactosidase